MSEDIDDCAETSVFRQACTAVLEITTARESIERLPQTLIDTWWYAPDNKVQDVFRYSGRVPFKVRRQVSFLNAERLATEARETEDRQRLRNAIRSLAFGTWVVSKSNETGATAQVAALACLKLLSVCRHPQGRRIRADLRKRTLEASSKTALPSALGIDWVGFERAVKVIQRGAQGAREMDGTDLPAPALSGAADAVLASPPTPAEVTPPTYDSTDQDRRVRAVELTGFRGFRAPSV